MVSMSGKLQFAALDSEAAWQQVQRRDANAAFFYAVTTTGVFCRPGCASRLPLKANVRFFRTADEARAAGFRPCQRCHPDSTACGSPLVEERATADGPMYWPPLVAECVRNGERSGLKQRVKRFIGLTFT